MILLAQMNMTRIRNLELPLPEFYDEFLAVAITVNGFTPLFGFLAVHCFVLGISSRIMRWDKLCLCKLL
jgi:hypothetical protein